MQKCIKQFYKNAKTLNYKNQNLWNVRGGRGSILVVASIFIDFAGDSEIKSSIIGTYIMEALSHLDQVAYVRFASVYKNFREVKDFEDFLDNLEDK